MLRHRLAALFEPRSVLVLSNRLLTVTKDASASAQGSLTFVSALPGQALGVPAVLNGVESGDRLDLALVCVPASQLAEALKALTPHRPRSLVLLSPGQPSTTPLEDAAYCRAWGQLNDCSVLGPRSFGVQRPHLGLNLSHVPDTAQVGRVALVAQSRSIVTAVLDWAKDVRLGFSAVISLGDESTVGVSEVLDYLAMDRHTDSIVLCLESTPSARELTSALSAAAGVKPVVVLKTGHGELGPGSAENAVFNALLRRVGVVRVPYFVQLFSAIKVLRYTSRPRGRRIALFSNGTAAPQLALDVMGLNTAVFRADLSTDTVKALRSALEPGAEIQNPIVTQAVLAPDKTQEVVDILASDPGVDGVLVLLSPDPLSDMPAVAHRLAQIAPDARKPIITCFMGEATMRPLRHILDDVGTPAFRTPESAANAFGLLASYHYNQTLSQQTLPPEPLSKPPRLDEARALIAAAKADGRYTLTPAESQQLFDCFYVPVQAGAHPLYVVGNPAIEEIPMAIRVSRDAKFGPYIRFGSSGRGEVSISDRAIDLPPLNSYLARQLVQRSALWRRELSRRMSPAAFDYLQEALERISDLVCELPEIVSIVIDPLFASSTQLIAHSICIDVSTSTVLVLPETSGYPHMAIHPYPRRLVQTKTFADGTQWTLRPIRPVDAEPLQEFVRDLSQEARYMRFVSMLRELTPQMLARYTRIDYDRELALVATVQTPNPKHRGHPHEQIVGFAHYLRNPDGRGAEYALVISDAWQRCGLGKQLMGGLIEAAHIQGLTYIDGFVLASNSAMLGLLTHLGFQNDNAPDDPSMRRVWLDLGETRAGQV